MRITKHRLGDHRVDQANDGSLARHVPQVFEIFLFARSQSGRVRRIGRDSVIAVVRIQNVLLRGKPRTDFQAQMRFEIGDRLLLCLQPCELSPGAGP